MRLKPRWTPPYALAALALFACAEQTPSDGASADATLVRDATGASLPPLRDTEVSPGASETGPPDPARDATTPGTDVGPQGDRDARVSSLDLGTVADADLAEDASADAAPPPPDCSTFTGRDDVTLCEASAVGCAVVFNARQGCAAVCADAGLRCLEAQENADGACAADRGRPALSCDTPSDHGSDWCLCGPGVGPPPPPPPPPPSTAPPGPCGVYPFSAESLLAERVGFGANARGGDPDAVYRVSSRANSGPGTLRDALESQDSLWIVFDVEGEFVFDFDDEIRVRSNKTVDGRGRDVRLRDARFSLGEGTRNVIFSDFEAYFDDPQDGEGDLFGLRGPGGPSPDDYTTRDIWFHHLDLHHAGDGLIDVRGATGITLSWTHVHDHTKVMLHTSETDGGPSPGMRITYHHNFFDTVTRRGPHFAYGLADFFNNYQLHWYEYGAAAIDEAQFLSEANIFEARPGDFCLPACPDPSPHGGGDDFFVSKIAVSHDWAQDRTSGFVRSVGDLLLNGARVETNQAQRVFDRATYYDAQPEPATPELAARIRAEAGPRSGLCR